MICPVDKNDMIVVEHKKTELDFCPKCHGVWFDSGELELFLQSLQLENASQFFSDIQNAAEVKSAEKKRKCPICGRSMKKSTIGQKTRMLIDICRKGDGLWFDGGEVEQLIKGLGEKPGEKAGAHELVTSFLGHVFQKHE